MNQIDSVFHALSDPTRRRVVELLGEGPRRASDLADGVGMARASMSRHLSVLRSSGLVEVEFSSQDARARVYRLRGERLEGLGDWLDEVQAHWSDQLQRFKRHTERRKRR